MRKKNTKIIAKIMLLGLVVLILSGCNKLKRIDNIESIINPSLPGQTGIIKYMDLEGGFYGIVADDGEDYNPLNLPQEFKTDGLRVKFSGKIRDDVYTVQMWGRVIELESINKYQGH